MRKTEDGSGWEPDELLMDERWLAVNVNGQGPRGVQRVPRTLRDRQRASGTPMPVSRTCRCTPWLGGLHLSGVNEAIIPQTVEAMKALQAFNPIAAAIGTGWRAMAALFHCSATRSVAITAVGKQFV